MAWSDAGQRLEALPTAGTGCNFVISDCPALSTPATIAGRCRYQSLIASGMIYVHISPNCEPHGIGLSQNQRCPHGEADVRASSATTPVRLYEHNSMFETEGKKAGRGICFSHRPTALSRMVGLPHPTHPP